MGVFCWRDVSMIQLQLATSRRRSRRRFDYILFRYCFVLLAGKPNYFELCTCVLYRFEYVSVYCTVCMLRLVFVCEVC